jgi:hypothetical protein
MALDGTYSNKTSKRGSLGVVSQNSPLDDKNLI